MAEALSFFVKEFGRAFDMDEWRVLASYDPKVTSKYVPSRKYDNVPAAIVRESLAEFAKRGTAYRDVVELVLDRTDAGSDVSEALRADARRAGQESRRRTDLEAADAPGALELLRIGFVQDAVFRTGFEERLQRDHPEQDLEGFWQGVDELLDGVAACDLSRERGRVMRPQRDVVASFVLACLVGARDYRQDFGREPEATPPLGPGARYGAAPAPHPAGAAQLLPVVRTGEGVADFQAAPAGAGAAALVLEPGRRARIGRERAWCEADGALPVVVNARYASRRHAELRFEGGRWLLEDCSTYGTLITRAVAPAGGAGAGSAGGVGAGGESARGGAGAGGEFSGVPAPATPAEQRIFANGETVELRHGDLVCLAPVQNRGMVGPRQLAADPSCKNFRFEILA